MRPTSPTPPLNGDRGSTLAELVIAMGLTALALTAIVGLISSSAGTVNEISADDPLAPVTIDWVADDLREATGLDVVATGGADEVTQIRITTPDGTIEWATADGTVERTGPGAVNPQPVLDGVRTTNALVLRLVDDAGAAVDVTDANAVDLCTRSIELELLDPDDEVLHQRTVGLRILRWGQPPC